MIFRQLVKVVTARKLHLKICILNFSAFNFAAAPPTIDKPTFQFGASEPAQISSNQSIGFNFGGATTAGSTPFQFSAAKPASSAGITFYSGSLTLITSKI